MIWIDYDLSETSPHCDVSGIMVTIVTMGIGKMGSLSRYGALFSAIELLDLQLRRELVPRIPGNLRILHEDYCKMSVIVR